LAALPDGVTACVAACHVPLRADDLVGGVDGLRLWARQSHRRLLWGRRVVRQKTVPANVSRRARCRRLARAAETESRSLAWVAGEDVGSSRGIIYCRSDRPSSRGGPRQSDPRARGVHLKRSPRTHGPPARVGAPTTTRLEPPGGEENATPYKFCLHSLIRARLAPEVSRAVSTPKPRPPIGFGFGLRPVGERAWTEDFAYRTRPLG